MRVLHMGKGAGIHECWHERVLAFTSVGIHECWHERVLARTSVGRSVAEGEAADAAAMRAELGALKRERIDTAQLRADLSILL